MLQTRKRVLKHRVEVSSDRTSRLADWVQYHADMGVEGIHLYAAVADFILLPQGGGFAHLPGSYRALSIDSHRLLRWKVFHPSPWSLHYYGQVCLASPIQVSCVASLPQSLELHRRLQLR